MAFMPLMWLALIGAIVWLATRSSTQPPAGRYPAPDPRPTHRETPEEVLDRRLALGEIDGETYTDARERLAAHRSVAPPTAG